MKRTLIILLILSSSALMAEEEFLVGNKMRPDTALQEQAYRAEKDFIFIKGDTIVVGKGCDTYLTGEKLSPWVYYVRHTIQQVGGRRFSDGILVAGINSWVPVHDVLLYGPVERADSLLNASLSRVEKDRREILERQGEMQNLDDKTRNAAGRMSDKTGGQVLESVNIDSITAAEAEAAALARREDSVRRAALREDSIMNVAPESVAAPLANADSVLSERDRYVLAAEDADRQRIADSLLYEERLRAFRLNQQHRLTIGLRGGVASQMQQTQNNVMHHWKAGYDALLDLQYAYYFGAREGLLSKTNLGIITGVSIGYSRSPLSAAVDTTYSVTDNEGEQIDYTISAAEVNEKNAQLQLEIPLLFSIRHQTGVFANIGPKVMIPLYSHYNQRLTDPSIDAYYPQYGVHVVNEDITGKIQEEQQRSGGRWEAAKVHVVLTGEIGYEWMLSSGNAVAVGAFADYSLYNLYKNKGNGKSLIEVGLPQVGGADVNVHSATNTYGTKIGFFDCGVKVSYHICFPKQ